MKILLLTVFLMTVGIEGTTYAQQTVTQEQCQQADAQLNQIYQQLRGSLNAERKQQLKLAQRDWIKKRDAFVAANPGNPQGALYQVTMQRVGELTRFLGGTPRAPKEDSSIVTTAQQSNQQTVTQEQCQKADAQMNEAYRELLSIMNDAQKQQLKLAQRDWIKKRDAFVAANPANPEGALYQATIKRRDELVNLVVCDANPEQLEKILNEKIKSFKRELYDFEVDIFEKDYKDLLTKEKNESSVGYTIDNHIRYKGVALKLKVLNKYISEAIDTYKKHKKGLELLSMFKKNDEERIGKVLGLYKNIIYSDLRFGMEIPLPSEEVAKDYANYRKTIEEIRDSWMGIKSNTNYSSEYEIESANPLKQERHVSSERSIINFPNTDTNEFINGIIYSHTQPLGVVVQNFPIKEVISEAKSSSYIAKSFLNDPKIYIFDKKSGIQLYSYNPTSVMGSVRDKNMTPIHLSFSKDERYLVGTTGYSEYNGSNLSAFYILNLNTLHLHYAMNTLPFIVRNENGNITMPCYNFMSKSNSVSDNFFRDRVDLKLRKEQYFNEGLKLGSKYFNYDDIEQASIRFAEEDFKSKDSRDSLDNSQTLITTDAFIVGNRDKRSFTVMWPDIIGTNESLALDLLNVRLSKKSLEKVVPTTLCIRTTNPTMVDSWVENADFWNWNSSTASVSTNSDIFNNGYANIKCKYISTNNVVHLIALDQDHQGKQGRTFSIFNTSSGKKIAKPNWPNPTDREIFPFSFNADFSATNKNEYYLPIMLPSSLSRYDQERFHYLEEENRQLWISCDKYGIFSIDLDSEKILFKYTNIPAFQFFATTENYILGVKDKTVPKLQLWDKKSQYKVLDIYPGTNETYYFVTPDNYYLGRSKGKPIVAFKIGMRGYPLEQFDLRLNRPDIVLERLGAPKEAIETAKSLRDKRLKRMGVTEDMLKPDFHLPEIQIVGEVPATNPKDQLDLQIKATDDQYPLDRLRVYVNNVPVNGRDGELLRDQKTQSLEKTIPIKLAAGRNKIQVSVLNSAGAESLYANAEVNCTAERTKPKLYAVALGVSQYDRPEWCLKYAAKDATDLINTLQGKAGSSYSEVKPLLLTDKEVTKESAAKIKEFLAGATIDDTVLIFMAGHGLLDDKYDYYFGTTDIDPAKPSERGMPYEAIDNILAEVPSLKKALLMDTCHAGELDDDEKKELAATDGSSAPAPAETATNAAPLAGKVAMRAIGTRGMQVKAVEGAKVKSDWYEKLQDMFVDLRRGSGATVISSSQGAEYAFESSEQSNGLFTYSLMEALDGKATPNKEGQITISAIGDYVKKRVQDLTKGKQNPNLRGVNLEEDFNLSSTK